jgi:hypothetical protein
MSKGIPSEFKCGRCHQDMRVDPPKGCTCCRSHGYGGRKITVKGNKEEPYDGYGYYDYARYLMDHL